MPTLGITHCFPHPAIAGVGSANHVLTIWTRFSSHTLDIEWYRYLYISSLFLTLLPSSWQIFVAAQFRQRFQVGNNKLPQNDLRSLGKDADAPLEEPDLSPMRLGLWSFKKASTLAQNINHQVPKQDQNRSYNINQYHTIELNMMRKNLNFCESKLLQTVDADGCSNKYPMRMDHDSRVFSMPPGPLAPRSSSQASPGSPGEWPVVCGNIGGQKKATFRSAC